MLVELILSRIIGLKYVLCCFYWIYLGNFLSYKDEFLVKVKMDVYMLLMYIMSLMLFGFYKFGIVFSIMYSFINYDVFDFFLYVGIK